MIILYLFVKGFQGIFWCFGIMIWLCFALCGAMIVATLALLCIPFHRSGQIWRDGMRSLRPPAYLRIKSHA